MRARRHRRARAGLRYRRYASLVERQQQRWILFGLATVLLPAVAALAAAALDATRWMVAVLFGMALIGSVLPAASAEALFRYRLFDLDRVVSRTLSWTALTALLAASYSGLIIALQAVLAPLAGGSDLAVAVSTLTVAALFSTVRQRVQAIVETSGLTIAWRASRRRCLARCTEERYEQPGRRGRAEGP